MPNKEGRWVTIHGRAIFIGEGQSLEEAMNSKGQVKKAAGGSKGSASAPRKARSSDIPEAYRGVYKIGKDDPDSYKTGDTIDGMKILASLDPKNDDDDETPYAYLTDSKEHPVVTIVHDRVYDVDKPAQASAEAGAQQKLDDFKKEMRQKYPGLIGQQRDPNGHVYETNGFKEDYDSLPSKLKRVLSYEEHQRLNSEYDKLYRAAKRK